MVKINLKILKNRAKREIEKSQNLKELDEVFKKYLGKRGKVTEILRSLEKLSKRKRAKIGNDANKLKEFLVTKLDKKSQEIKKKIEKEIEGKEWIDVTAPGRKPISGHLHPLTQAKREIEEIFQSMGFSVISGPEIEDEWHNFDALNIPPDHPARDVLSLGKSLYLKSGGVMRSHTSAVQIRYMEKNPLPLRIIVPGRVFRYEATDPSHEIQLHQIEGLMVDKKGKVSVASFKAIIEEFFRKFFKKEIETRLRPSYFPFTEPSFEVDISCPICEKKGCSVCKDSGWVEIMGAGMAHPNVFKNCGLNPNEWQGFAFGMGMDRLAMIKYKINDIRLFHSGDLRFLNQF